MLWRSEPGRSAAICGLASQCGRTMRLGGLREGNNPGQDGLGVRRMSWQAWEDRASIPYVATTIRQWQPDTRFSGPRWPTRMVRQPSIIGKATRRSIRQLNWAPDRRVALKGRTGAIDFGGRRPASDRPTGAPSGAGPAKPKTKAWPDAGCSPCRRSTKFTPIQLPESRRQAARAAASAVPHGAATSRRRRNISGAGPEPRWRSLREPGFRKSEALHHPMEGR